LGHAVGNSLEVLESIAALRGDGPEVLVEHALRIAGEMLHLGGLAGDLTSGISMARDSLASGAAFTKFRELIEAQGGEVAYVDDPDRFPRAPVVECMAARESGYVAGMDAGEIGMVVVSLGGGREKKGDPIDHRVGVVMHVRVGDQVEKGQALFTLHAGSEADRDEATERLRKALLITPDKVAALPLFYDRVASSESGS
jgi:pyrimidine-nucleoside phosphorylase